MKICSFVRAAYPGFILLLAGNVAAQAAEIKVIVSPGFAPIMQDIGPTFERATGHKLAVSSNTLGAIVKRVHGGEMFDVVLGPRSAIDGFVKDGKAPAGNVTVVASAGMGSGRARRRPEARHLIVGSLQAHTARRKVDQLSRSE